MENARHGSHRRHGYIRALRGFRGWGALSRLGQVLLDDGDRLGEPWYRRVVRLQKIQVIEYALEVLLGGLRRQLRGITERPDGLFGVPANHLQCREIVPGP